MAHHSYFVYGLHIAANQPIAGLPIQPYAGSPDVRLDIQGAGAWTFAPVPDELMLNGVKSVGDQWHSLKVWQAGETLHVRYELTGEQVDFSVSAAGDRVQVIWSRDFPADDVPAFFLGPAIGCVLRLRGILALHAGVVSVGDKAVAILGEKGAGKSTLIGEFARQGYPILSDDVAPLVKRNGQFWVQPGYPRLRLWPTTLDWLGVFHPDLPRVESIFEKRYFGLCADSDDGPWRFANRPLPLVAIYTLESFQADATPTIQPLIGTNSLNTLLKHCYADYVLAQAGRLEQFKQLADLAARVPVRAVHRPEGLNHLDDTCRAIDQDVRFVR